MIFAAIFGKNGILVEFFSGEISKKRLKLRLDSFIKTSFRRNINEFCGGV